MLTGGAGTVRAAVSPPPPKLPTNAVDPWDAFVNRKYSSQELNQLIDRFYYEAGPPSTVTEADQAAYYVSRLGRFQRLMRLAPALEDVAPFVRFAGTAGLVLTAGYYGYQIYKHFAGHTDKTQYVLYNRGTLGGQQVIVPGVGTQGIDWRADPSYFGWKWQPDCNGPSMTGTAGCWAFKYVLQVWSGTSSGGYAWSDYPAPEYTNYGTTSFPAAVPSYDWCSVSTTNEGNCLSGASSLGMNGGGKPNVVQGSSIIAAAWYTYGAIDGRLTPLKVVGDLNANSVGHMLTSSYQCNRGGVIGVSCGIAYVDAISWDRNTQRTETLPAGADLGGTSTYNVSSDAGTTAADSAAIAADETPCGRAIFNNIVDPENYPYSGCTDAGSDSNGGQASPITPQPSPQPAPQPGVTQFVIPEPQPGETAAQYAQRLRAAGLLGRIAIEPAGAAFPAAVHGTGPMPGEPLTLETHASPAAVSVITPVYNVDGTRAPWPLNPPVLQSDGTVTITEQPLDAPIPPGGSPGAGGTSGSCDTPSVPPLDLTPLQGVDVSGKFPFGIFGWAKDGVAGWVGNVDAPTMTIPLLGYTSEHATVDFAVLDPVMPTFRAAIMILATFCAFYWLATAFLGLGGSTESE